ncbi:ABC transporter permease [Chitinophaga oryzae]|uniref:ABC transporter permease n=1 Tax=Chitinophaga oryzae TaxID=2725414 RepID=A0ABX6LIS8_9BACT|nr:ABC transporter permease [Chitinophaga oryzae]QJB40030.1 ABC transporter permease [Chitinophaga oryzae]
MLRNYLKTAWRNVVNNKVYSALNIVGLGIGMAVGLLIILWVANEYSYDRFLPGHEQLYQVMKNNPDNNGGIRTVSTVSLPLTDVLRKDIPGIRYVAVTDWSINHGLVAGDKKLYLRGSGVSEDYLRMFRFSMLEGDAGSALQGPNSIVLCASTARALFGTTDVVNKLVRIDNQHDLKVTGVVQDVPANSTLQFKYLIPYSYLIQTQPWLQAARNDWGDNSSQAFVALEPGVSFEKVSAQIKDIIHRYDAKRKEEIFLHPMDRWRLYSDFENGKASGGFITYVQMFTLIGVLVLLIACINFVNLSTARSEKRAREVGVRKAIGSGRRDLVMQFLLESLMLTGLAAVLSIGMLQLALPLFNRVIDGSLHVPYDKLSAWGILLLFIVVTAVMAGSRPAFYLSSFEPVKVLKGGQQAGKSAVLPRKVMVVAQFAASVALIISTIIIYQQIQYAKKRPAGYNASGLLYTYISEDMKRNYHALRQELLQSGVVESVVRASNPVTSIWSRTVVEEWQGRRENQPLMVSEIAVSAGYFSAMGMHLKEGRDFYPLPANDSGYVIINEAAVKRMGLTAPVAGQHIRWRGGEPAVIAGVIKDAVMESPFKPVEPAVFAHRDDDAITLLYRLTDKVDMHTALAKIAPVFNKYNPGYAYDYTFAADSYNKKFKLEALSGQLAAIFAVLAVFISCLGLFGLAAYVAAQRTREIAIRKVMGASIVQLWLMLSKDFVTLVFIGCCIAVPVSFYSLQHWLDKYAYRIHIGPGVFMVAAGAALLITICTISYQTIRAALANPMHSLKAE